MVVFFRTYFRVTYAFLKFPDWIICWHIFNRYLICFESNDFKCTGCSSLDDNMNSHNLCTDITSDCNRLFLWQMDDDFILVIMYDTQACTFGTVILFKYTSLSTRSYSNRLSLSSMLGESFLSSILWLRPWCGKQSGIDISLMMYDRFFVNFQHIGINVLVFLCGYVFLSLILHNRCLDDFKPIP